MSPIISRRALSEDSVEIIEASFVRSYSVFFIAKKCLFLVYDAKLAIACANSRHKLFFLIKNRRHLTCARVRAFVYVSFIS